jgi:hypothetical protein
MNAGSNAIPNLVLHLILVLSSFGAFDTLDPTHLHLAVSSQVSARLVEKFRVRFPPESSQAVLRNVRTTYRFVSGQQE